MSQRKAEVTNRREQDTFDILQRKYLIKKFNFFGSSEKKGIEMKSVPKSIKIPSHVFLNKIHSIFAEGSCKKVLLTVLGEGAKHTLHIWGGNI